MDIIANPYCFNDVSGTIVLDSSEIGMNYTLMRDLPISSQPGTGNALVWNDITANTGYYIVAENAAYNSCKTNTDTVSMIHLAQPTVTLSSTIVKADIGTVDTILLTNLNADTDVWLYYSLTQKDSVTSKFDSIYIHKTGFPDYIWNYLLPANMGTYYLKLTRITDLYGCETMLNDSVIVIATSCLNVAFTMDCPKDTVATISYGACEFQFTSLGKPLITVNGADQSLDTTITITHNGPADLIFGQGQYEIMWYAENDCGVKDSCTQWVVVNYPPCSPLDTVWYVDALGQIATKIDSLYAIDFETNRYPTVRINCDCWMAENLTSTLDRNGDPIPSYIYQTKLYSDTAANLAKYGRLYDGITASKGGAQDAEGRVPGICPDGWVLPTYAQYEALIPFGSDALRQINEWMYDHSATNSTGFSSLPAGYYFATGQYFTLLMGDTYFWTSDCYQGTGKVAHIRYSCPVLQLETMSSLNAVSVRCVKK